MLTDAIDRAWVFGTQRVWLHTCTLDHPAALGNYLARGFKVFKEELGVKVGERYVSQPQIVPFEDSIGTETRAHQWPGSDFGESQG